jgi:hypothetical protein
MPPGASCRAAEVVGVRAEESGAIFSNCLGCVYITAASVAAGVVPASTTPFFAIRLRISSTFSGSLLARSTWYAASRAESFFAVAFVAVAFAVVRCVGFAVAGFFAAGRLADADDANRLPAALGELRPVAAVGFVVVQGP